MAYSEIDISPKEACWVFVSTHTEPRHLYDIVLGVDSLRKIGVSDENIYIFTDHIQSKLEFSVYKIDKNIFGIEELCTKIASIDYKYAFVCVTGHGCEFGLPLQNGTVISPNSFFDCIRSIKNLDTAVGVICQCYAGIFNFIEAYSDPKLVVLGGTNLNLSLSLPVNINPPIEGAGLEIDDSGNEVEVEKNLFEWAANTFLYYLFEWIRSHVDIDGDGKMTVMDMYKYAGAKASNELRKSKSELVNEVKIYESLQLDQLVKMRNIESIDEQKQKLLDIHSQQKNLNNKLEILYNHQEPWILNSNYARVINIS